MLVNGPATTMEVETFLLMFGLILNFFKLRLCRDGVGGQHLGGMANSVRTSQDRDGLAVTEKLATERLRSQKTLPDEAEDMAALGFVMDGVLRFLPLTHVGESKLLDDVGACSILDFSMRMFQTGEKRLEMYKYELKEKGSVAASGGRRYEEARIWDEKGKMVARMTQACILSSKPKTRKGDKL